MSVGVCVWVLGRSREIFFCFIFPGRTGGWRQLIWSTEWFWDFCVWHGIIWSSALPRKTVRRVWKWTWDRLWCGGGCHIQGVHTCFYSSLALWLPPVSISQGNSCVSQEPLPPQPGPGMHHPCSPGNAWHRRCLPELSWEGLHLPTCQN